MKRNNVYVGRFELESTDVEYSEIQKLIEKYIRNNSLDEYEGVKIYFSCVGTYDYEDNYSDTRAIEIKFYRAEIDEEYENRLKREEEAKKAYAAKLAQDAKDRRKNEKRLFLELQKKYGKKEKTKK